MEEKNEMIKNYVYQLGTYLNNQGINVSSGQMADAIERFSNSSVPLEEIIKNLDELAEEMCQNHQRQLLLAQMEKMRAESVGDLSLAALNVPHMGITLNNQQIDLMMIASADTPQQLQVALSKITNIDFSLSRLDLSEEEFTQVRQEVFDQYKSSLKDVNLALLNPKSKLQGKLEHLFSKSELSEEMVSKIKLIVFSTGGSVEKTVQRLQKEFSSEEVRYILRTLREYSPIEKDGVKDTSLQAYRNLYDEVIENYNSITIDDEAKYYGVTLYDGSFEFSHLQKSFDFAKSLDKQMRLNTVCFYMDCPKELYKLDVSEENKRLVKSKLTSYVDAITKFVSSYEKENGQVVRSVDVLNELLNRFAMEGEPPYAYRGDITQPDIGTQEFDNVAAGWQKHLTIEDLCDVIMQARQNLPDKDFMFNEANLEDPRKLPYFVDMVKRIQQYEQEYASELNGKKIIDSIGTQMHVDTSMTKEQMYTMLKTLGSLGLPVEITEFDMCVPLELLDTLGAEEIEQLKQLKLNEFCQCVQELQEQCNIRGVTIWSVNDKHNFMLALTNERLIREGAEVVSTLYGGYYGEDMRPRNKALQKEQRNIQSFNYHTHTNRCGHAGIFEDVEYVDSARANGIARLGFSDHVPFTQLEFQDIDGRMHLNDVDEYISSIRNLQLQFPNMDISCGFEAEFDPRKEQFLGDLREKVDYMILGQHFLPEVSSQDNPNYPLQYAEMVCQGMDSGIFDIVAHPDIFMQEITSITTPERRVEFLKNSRLASKKICEKAKSLQIPLEINFGKLDKVGTTAEYPSSLFWEVAANTGVSVLYGADAHYPKSFDKMGQNIATVEQKMNIPVQKLNFVPDDYHPVKARESNVSLDRLYQTGQQEAMSFETHLIGNIIDGALKRIPENSDVEMMSYASREFLQRASANCQQVADQKDKNVSMKMDKIVQDGSTSLAEKKFQLNRIQGSFATTNATLSNQQAAITRGCESVQTVASVGCGNKQEFSMVTKQLTESKAQTNPVKKEAASQNVANFQASKQPVITIKSQHDKPRMLTKAKSKPSGQNSGSQKGFASVLSVSSLFGVMVGVLIGLLYVIYTFLVL